MLYYKVKTHTAKQKVCRILTKMSTDVSSASLRWSVFHKDDVSWDK